MLAEVVREQLESGLAGRVFPAGQVAVRAGDRSVDVGLGRTSSVGRSEPVSPRTRFDVASLTKALSTSVLLMQAVESGALSLDQPVSRWFPRVEAADSMQVGHLASHRAGLAAHRPFFEVLEREGYAEPAAAWARLLSLIEAEPLEAAPGEVTRYSDLGYLLLGRLLEETFGDSLSALFQRRIARPLALEHTRFGPVTGSDVAATELDEDGEPIRGVVHDENARSIGGIAGHAGLFSTASDVAAIGSHLARVHAGAGGIVRPETVQRFWKPIPGGSFTLGWDTPTEPSSSGRYTTRGASVGHLGFTGCSLWHDIAREVTVVLLTNRVHPTRENTAIRQFRPRFHDAVNEALALH